MVVTFELDGQPFIALNGGPEFTFNEAISFQVECESQAEVDDSGPSSPQGGEEGAVRLAQGQVRRVVADRSHGLVRADARPRPERTQRVMKAMLGMKKLDIAELQRAANSA